MAIYTLPDGVEFTRRNWVPFETVQINEGGWNRARYALDFDNGYMVVSATMLPTHSGELKRRLRSFYSKLKAGVSAFRLPVSACAQHGGVNANVAARTFTFNLTAGMTAFDTNTRFKKTGGSGSAWDQSVRSVEGSYAARVSFKVSQVNKNVIVGLSSNPAASTDISNISFGILFTDAGSAMVYQDNVNEFVIGAYLATDTWVAAKEGASVAFYKNGTEVYRADADNGVQLYFDTSFFGSDGEINTVAVTAPSGAAGSTVVALSAAPGALEGMYATVPLEGGAAQLVLLHADAAGGELVFEPPLRGVADVGEPVETMRPYGVVALTEAVAPDEDQGIMTWAFDAREAF